LFFGKFIFFNETVERLSDRRGAAIQRLLRDLHEDDVEAGASARLCDAVAHETGAADADCADFGHENVPFQTRGEGRSLWFDKGAG
jgi:hypothetical protein